MNQVGSVEIVIKGGRPWGFTLQGGIENRSALTVAQIEPNGKAERHGVLKVGDHVLKINDVQCFSLADATQLIECAFRTLTVLVWRSKSAVSVPGPQVRSVSKYGALRSPKDEGVVVHKASFAKITPQTSPNNQGMHKPQEPPDNNPSKSIRPDAQSNWSGYPEPLRITNLGSPGDRSPLNSFVSFMSLDRSGSELSLSSTTDCPENVRYQAHDSVNRYSRSPRNLTKDSGYETCAQGEHDYVNMEWVSSPLPPDRHPTSPPAGYTGGAGYINESLSPSEEYLPRYPPMNDYFQKWHRGIYENSSLDQYRSTEDNSGSSGYGDSKAPFEIRTGSCSSLYSSYESLSSRSSKAEVAQIRPAKSSLSLKEHPGKNSALSYVHKPDTHAVTPCQYLIGVVSPALSAPNLHCKGEMAPRRFNKKQSVYEELACKSGFDFSPMVQRQPSWPPKQAFEASNSFAKPAASSGKKTDVKEGPHGRCDNVRTSKSGLSYYKQDVTAQKVELPSHINKLQSSPPPPVPSRDSSLFYRTGSTHEKFPSWPASPPFQRNSDNSVPTSGCRSNSWAENSHNPRVPMRSYSRPATHYQISPQQLPPVQEKARKSSGNSHLPSNDEVFSERVFGNASESFSFDCIYQNCEVFRPSDKKCDMHSPPEREGKALSRSSSNSRIDAYTCKQESPYRMSSKGSDLYENVSVNDCNNTPLLDRLRQERQSFSLSWSDRPPDAHSDVGTFIGSNSSSQETLKWRGSSSDLIPPSSHADDESLQFDSDSSTIYEELRPRSIDGSEKSYSTLCSSPVDFTADNCTKGGGSQCQYATDMHPLVAVPSRRADLPSETFAFAEKSFGISSRPSKNQSSALGTEIVHERNMSGPSSLPVTYYSHHSSTESINSSICKKPSVTTPKNENSGNVSWQTPYVTAQQESYNRNQMFTNSPSQNLGNFKGNPEKSRSFSWDLKTIQKQAVISFYHRQKALSSKDSSCKKAPRSSSFSYTGDNLATSKTSSQGDRNDIAKEKTFARSSFSLANADYKHPQPNRVVKKSDMLSPKVSNKSSVPDATDVQTHLPIRPSWKLESEQAVDSVKEADADIENNQPDRISQLPARKAYLKKSGRPKENPVVKVLSSEGVVLAKGNDEERIYSNCSIIKPQVPLKQFHKKSSDAFSSNQQAYAHPSLVTDNVNEEDIHSQQIDRNKHDSSGFVRILSPPQASSPELQLPPPPTQIETEILITDDPFPPPPTDLQDFYKNNEVQKHCDKINGLLKQELNSYLHCDSTITSFEKPRPSIPSTQSISYPLRASPVLMPENPMPAATLAPTVQHQERQITCNKDEQYENEVVYMNVDFGRKLFDDANSGKPFTPSLETSVTSSATQTSSTPSLPRKANEFLKRNTNLTSTSLHNIDYLRNQVPVCDKSHSNETGLDQNCHDTIVKPTGVYIKRSSPASSYSPPQMSSVNDLRDEIGLPLTNPYFTTSEPKAKLLTRYCQTFDKQWSDHGELKGQKEELIASISKKLNVLRLEQIEIKKEMKQNEELGQEVTLKIKTLAKPNEVHKYQVHVEELEKIINLLLSLSGRLARAENALLLLPKDAKMEEKNILEAKRNKLSQQHDEAWRLKENIDRRSSQVSLFLKHYLSKEEFADYEHFIKMKSKLLMDAKDIDEKIRLGEEQLSALRGTFQVIHTNGEIIGAQESEITILVET